MSGPRRLTPDDPAMGEVLALMRAAFAGMEGRIDPPSSIHRLTLEDLRGGPGEVWAIGTPPVAAAVFTARDDALYLGKIAVAADQRGRGLSRALIDAAERRARALGLPALTLQSRVELIENHAVFAALGFAKTGETAHEGYDRATSLTFTKDLR